MCLAELEESAGVDLGELADAEGETAELRGFVVVLGCDESIHGGLLVGVAHGEVEVASAALDGGEVDLVAAHEGSGVDGGSEADEDDDELHDVGRGQV